MKKKIPFLIASVLLLSIFVSGCGNDYKTNDNISSYESTNEQSNEISPNTSEMVDSIVLKAKNDAGTATDDQKQEALDFIKNNIDDCFKDNDTMENMMYYGALLEYAYQNNENMEDNNIIMSNLGSDAVQTVKYVYRNVETKDDDSTKENISQVKDGIKKIEELEKIN